MCVLLVMPHTSWSKLLGCSLAVADVGGLCCSTAVILGAVALGSPAASIPASGNGSTVPMISQCKGRGRLRGERRVLGLQMLPTLTHAFNSGLELCFLLPKVEELNTGRAQAAQS